VMIVEHGHDQAEGPGGAEHQGRKPQATDGLDGMPASRR
jgi:hypothetical protein